jgi:hypothetical protein
MHAKVSPLLAVVGAETYAARGDAAAPALKCARFARIVPLGGIVPKCRLCRPTLRVARAV